MRKRARNLTAAAVCAGAMVLSAGAPANAAEPEPEVIPIDLMLAGSQKDSVRDAMDIWNGAVPTVKFVEQDTPAALRVKEYTTQNGTGSHAFVNGLGKGWVYLETGDAQKYKPSRLAVHELGHILSLADLGEGSACSKVMSGAWAGPECTNDQPDGEEITEVTDFFAANDVGDPVPGWPDPTEG